MPITGVFFIPSNPNSSTALATITQRLRSAFADEEPIPFGRWALEHKFMRDTPSCLPASANISGQQRPLKPRYMQFLSLSYYPNHGFIYTSQSMENQNQNQNAATPHLPHTISIPGVSPAGLVNNLPIAVPVAPVQSTQSQVPVPIRPTTTAANPLPPTATTQPGLPPGNPNATPAAAPAVPPPDRSPMIMTTAPLPSCAALFHHFVYACQPFWCHRHTVTVPAGLVYDVGDFRVRLGDVKQTQPTARVRGTVVEIEWKGPSLVDSITSQRTRNIGPDSHDAGIGADADVDDVDSGIGLNLDLSFSPSDITDADIDAEYVATAALIREFWTRLGVEGAREATLVPDLGKEVKGLLQTLKQEDNPNREESRRRATKTPIHRGGDIWESSGKQEDPDPEAGVDLARQFMEIFRFNR